MLARVEKERAGASREPILGVLGTGILWLLLTAGQGELTPPWWEPKLVPEEPEARGSAHSLNTMLPRDPFHQANGKECEGCRVRDSALRIVSSMGPSPPSSRCFGHSASPAFLAGPWNRVGKKNWVAPKNLFRFFH